MSGIEYIEIPIETDPEILAQDGFDYLEATVPGWIPNDANLETIMIEALSKITANARDLASAVPTSVFRSFGELVGVIPQEATFATSTITIEAVNTAGYTIPAGTQIGIQITGDVIIPFEVVVDAVIVPGMDTVTGVVIRALEAGSDSSDITGTATLIDTLDFVNDVTLEADTTGGVDAETDDDYLNRLRLRLQLLAPRPILARDFAILAQDISGVDRAVALDGYDAEHNLLTANQSSLETNTTGWTAGTNSTIAQDATQAADGTKSLRVRSVAGGDMNAVTTPNNMYAVVPGEQITAMTEFRAAANARSVRVDLVWYSSVPAFISSSNGTPAADTTSGWTAVSVTANAPGNAAFVVVRVTVLSTGGASEDHYVDKIALRHGNFTTNWTIGGTPETGVDRMVAVAVVDTDGNPVSSGIKTEVDDYLESLRELNFIVHIIDPVYTTIDAQFTVKALENYASSDVEASTEQAVSDYLSPENWGLPADTTGDATINPDWINKTVVRYLELANVINNVQGVDYIVSLELRVAGGSFDDADITLGGAVPLPNSGTITATVT